MKIAYSLVLSFSLTIPCLAQTRIDSLKTLLEVSRAKGNKDIVAIYLSNIGWEYLSTRAYDSALAYYYRSLDNSVADPKLRASTLDCIGVAYNFKGFPDSSILYYRKALDLYSKMGDTTHAIVIENNLSIIYKNKGLYEKALESAFNAISKLEKQKPDRTLASCYNTVGSIYSIISDYPSALIYFNKALSIRTQIAYSVGVGQSYNNIGETYLRMGQYDSALTYLFHALEEKRKTGQKSSMGSTLNLIGDAYVELGKLSEAEPYFIESRKIKKLSGERIEEAIVLNNLGKLKLKVRNLIQAERYINEAEVLIRKTEALDELRKNLELKVLLYKTIPNHSKALMYAEELVIVNDSLLNKEKAESLLSLQARYESKEKEQEIELLRDHEALQNAEIRTKKLWILGLTITAFLATTIVLLLFYGYNQSQRNKNRVETLLKELNHRVKNNLQILSSLLSLQSQHLTDENAIQAIKSSESRVNTMALIHKKLYGYNDIRPINTKEYIHELVQYLIHTYDFKRRNTDLIIQGKEIQLDVDKAIPLGLIVNEIVTNALKYAYIESEVPRLIITLSEPRPDELMLEVSDNGAGMKDTSHLESRQSFGLKMVKTLAKELKGKCEFHFQNGTTFILTIPTF